MNPGDEPIEVFKYKPGDYFGELALLRNQTRAASIRATSDLQVVSLGRDSFKRLFGSLESILKRNESRYRDYL